MSEGQPGWAGTPLSASRKAPAGGCGGWGVSRSGFGLCHVVEMPQLGELDSARRELVRMSGCVTDPLQAHG